MKSISKYSLVFLLMALCFSPKSFANQAEEATSTELKTGDNIILTESDQETDDVIKKINESTDGIKDKLVKEDNSPSENTEKNQENSQYETKNKESSLKDQNLSENNKTSNQQNSNSGLEISDKPNISGQQASSKKNTDELIVEIKKFLKDTQKNDKSGKNSNKNDDIKKKVEKVSDVVVSNKISKEESEKIAKATKDIVKEYNKKIESTESEKRRQELAQEAIDKINKSVKMASKEAYDYINKEDDELTIFDQKNETLVLEIEAPGKGDSKEDSSTELQSLDDKDNIKSKSSSLSRSPKLSTKKERKISSVPIILGIVLVIGISISLSLALKVRENNKIRFKN